jgi:hypothetical protein
MFACIKPDTRTDIYAYIDANIHRAVDISTLTYRYIYVDTQTKGTYAAMLVPAFAVSPHLVLDAADRSVKPGAVMVGINLCGRNSTSFG